ncbi:MAG: hypothetical protein M3301_03180 [Chloroflexota bacterium]|nr:hypothetical protein [Chloroflexota bacterium]
MLALAGLVLLGAALVEGNRSSWVFLGLVGFFAAWGAQAIDAYRRAVELGVRRGGAIQLLALAPAVIAAFTGFWLVGGGSASPAATLQRYVAVWRQGQADQANELFVSPPGGAALAARWKRDETYLRNRLVELGARLGPGSALDPDRPLDSLVFELVTTRETRSGGGTEGETAEAAVEFVRPVTVRDSFFGLFPTASQRTVVLEQVGLVRLRTVRFVPALGPASLVWRVESVEFGATSRPPAPSEVGSARVRMVDNSVGKVLVSGVSPLPVMHLVKVDRGGTQDEPDPSDLAVQRPGLAAPGDGSSHGRRVRPPAWHLVRRDSRAGAAARYPRHPD